MANILAISVFLVIFGAVLVHSKYLEGHLKTEEDWHFLARFCFLSQKGQLQFEFEYPLSLEPQNILLYYDDPDQWPAVYKSNKNCTQKKDVFRPGNKQIIVLSSDHYWSGCSRVREAFYRCSATRSFRTWRERWWFIALEHCGSEQGLNLKYKIWMTNGDDFWHKHFSADEFYILPVDIAFLIAMLVVLCVSIYTASVLKSRQMFHTTYKLYMVSLTFEVFHLFIMCIAYGKYANDGLENYGMRTFGRMFESASILVFLLMLILMGKGYTITRGRLSTGGSVKISIFMTLFVITYAVLFIYEAKFFDPGEVLYIYESPAGYGLVAMRLLGWIWFCYAIFFTLKHYPEKARFYYPFFIFYTLWFWAGPIVILIALKALSLWVREKVVNGVENTVSCVGHMFFLILTRPSAANSNFPYHVRTSQIGVMSESFSHPPIPHGASKESESFSSHPYAPSQPPPEYSTCGGPNFTELFTVSNPRPSAPQANSDQSGSNTELHAKDEDTSSSENANLDRFPHQQTTNNPFVTAQ